MLHRFFADLERLAAFLMICQCGINERIDRYGKLIDAVEKDADLYDADSPLQLSHDEQRQFVHELNGDIYRQVPKRRLYVLLRLDSALSDGSASYHHSVISIEHVLPQNPPPSSKWCEWFPTQELRDTWVHRLGNLLLLNHKKNSSASNYDFEKKKKAYFTKGGVCPFPLTTQAIGTTEWTLKVVNDLQTNALVTLRNVWRIEAVASNSVDPTGIPNDLADESEVAEASPGTPVMKFDVNINGEIHKGLLRHKAIHKIVKHLCDHGISPEDIASVIPWRQIFCSLDGTVSGKEFIAQKQGEIKTRTYFCGDDDLIHSSRRTYALSNFWGKRALEAIQNILAKFPDNGVSCEKHTGAIPLESLEEAASKESWKNHPMPKKRHRIGFQRKFTDAEFEKIKFGHIPHEMEDRWFVYFENGQLNFHRSWTGHCIFQVKLARVDDAWAVDEAWASQDESQYQANSEDEDIEMLKKVFQWSLGI